MSVIPEKGRLAAHVVIDAVSVFEPGAEGSGILMSQALQRLWDQQLFTVTDDAGHVDVELTDLLGGVMVSMNWLVTMLARERGTEEHAVIVELREWLDED